LRLRFKRRIISREEWNVTAQARISGEARTSRLLWPAVFGLIGLCYLAVFLFTRDGSLVDQLKSVARNLLSLAAAALAARAVMRRWLLGRSGISFWLGHAAAAIAFSLLWAWLLTIAVAIFQAGSARSFTVIPFLAGPAEAWQLLQGLFAYAALAAITELEHRLPPASLIIVNDPSPQFHERFLQRQGEALGVLAAADIVSITGADDYSELVTAGGTQLVATTLAEFENMLDPARFARVHRSAIANLDQIERAEPSGGGRMILRMRAGPDLPVSRTGAKRLRDRAL